MSIRIGITTDTCMSYGVCVQSAPTLFALDDEDDPVVLQPEAADSDREAAVLAQRSCPTNSVRIDQD